MMAGMSHSGDDDVPATAPAGFHWPWPVRTDARRDFARGEDTQCFTGNA